MGEMGGRLIATSSVVTAADLPAAWELCRVAVDPLFRRRGIGRAVVSAAIDAARQEGASRLHWVSDPFQTAAHRLYETLAEPLQDNHGRRHYMMRLDES